MELTNVKKTSWIMFILTGVMLLTACNKKFWDYDSAWVSETPYIYMPIESGKAVIEINGETKEVITAWSADGEQVEFYDSSEGESLCDENLIWVANVVIKKDELYLVIETDNYGKYNGETLVLKQEQTE